MNSFQIDLASIQKRARDKMEMGAVTASNQGNVEELAQVLNEALATELVCTLRYRQHYFVAEGIKAEVAAEEFLQHSKEEEAHADRIAHRIVQLGSKPNFDPASLTKRSHAAYVEKDSLKEMIEENLVAERIAIEIYTEMIRWIQDKDPTSRRLMEEILAQEEEHADEMADLLSSF